MKSNVILHMCNIKKYVMVILNRKQGVACDKYIICSILNCNALFFVKKCRYTEKRIYDTLGKLASKTSY